MPNRWWWGPSNRWAARVPILHCVEADRALAFCAATGITLNRPEWFASERSERETNAFRASANRAGDRQFLVIQTVFVVGVRELINRTNYPVVSSALLDALGSSARVCTAVPSSRIATAPVRRSLSQAWPAPANARDRARQTAMYMICR